MTPDTWHPRDLDTPHHDDHIRDNTLNAGCARCAPFFGDHDPWGPAWQRHRANLGYDSSVLLAAVEKLRAILDAGTVHTHGDRYVTFEGFLYTPEQNIAIMNRLAAVEKLVRGG